MVQYHRMLADSYDALYAKLRDPAGDREFYAGLAREHGGPVLEVGCGTGRVLLPIARTGLPCAGVDPSPEMLDRLRGKQPPPTLELVESEVESMSLARRDYALVYAAFRVFQHLLDVDSQLDALARIREHLRPGGVFAFDVFEPDLARMARDEPETREDETVEVGARTVRRSFAVRRDQSKQLMAITLRYLDANTDEELGRELINLRWCYRYELEHLLHRAGFEPLRWLSGFDGAPYDGSGEIIVVARRR